MALVEIQNVSKTFRTKVAGNTRDVHALSGVSFSLERGEIVAITGASGCGKTTMLRIIMGLEKASGGSVIVNGNQVSGCGYDRGMVFQHSELLPWRNAVQNVAFGLELKGMDKQTRDVEARRYLELVGLGHAADRLPHQLSGGMKQRVGIARALAIGPDVLLMDEPFGALDAQTREGLQNELMAIQAQTQQTIILVTHDLDEAVLLADRVVVMSQGRVAETLEMRLPRPRPSLAALRGNPEFGEKRLRLWELLKNEMDADARKAA
ncbi:ABC transporter ATP-binding protein [Devosia ginsengisoli]|uniref:ABC transporter ATP-binding protein n=1 Tax=Devosia ginsengisoli TaxID=400770 RepID=A0A5B8LV37_9HYPH|nr:ABC transporter ATP-binding protein [Devosia ginsengisoli]QDZ11681.1 ABC transporter ATP-binding protein [Devosia ginsengisoli]